MKKLITKEQEREIEELAKEHWDALIAFGADMYRDGLCKGAVIGMIGVAAGALIMSAVSVVTEKVLEKIHEKKEES